MRPIDARSYNPNSNDILLFDTNVLFKLFSPSQREDMHGYDTLFDRARKNDTRLLLTSIQISEFINRCIRIQYGLYKDDQKKPDMQYKVDYRSTDDYRESMDGILDIVKTEILPYFECIDDGFSEMKSDELYKMGISYDFNDSLLEQVAIKNSAKIVTSDFDFMYYAQEHCVITSNYKFLHFVN